MTAVGGPRAAPSLTASESIRQAIHVVSGLWVLLLPWVGWQPLFGLAIAALAFNLWVLPRVAGRWLWRPAEVRAGRSIGIVAYPLTVAILLVIFQRQSEVAAAGWGLLAFGDGAATLVGRGGGRRPLPWNRRKSWEGLLSYWIVGWISIFWLVIWVAPTGYSRSFLVVAAAIASLGGALVESAPQRLDDNLTAPLLASLLLACLLESTDGWQRLTDPDVHQRLIVGLVLNLALAGVAVALGALDRGGAATGTLLGTAIFAALGWGGLMVLATFFVVGSTVTRLGLQRKTQLGVTEGRGGRRRMANAIANGGIAALCALFALVTPHAALFVTAFVCSLAAAAADTVESEIGAVWGRTTRLITNLRPVAAGTDGGVSVVGSMAGVVAALAVVVVGWWCGLLPAAQILPVCLLAFLATLVESVAGATLERRGWLNNDGVNFLNTLVAALAGAALAASVA